MCEHNEWQDTVFFENIDWVLVDNLFYVLYTFFIAIVFLGYVYGGYEKVSYGILDYVFRYFICI